MLNPKITTVCVHDSMNILIFSDVHLCTAHTGMQVCTQLFIVPTR